MHKLTHVILVRPLALLGATPNQVTAVRLATGVAAALCLAAGGRGFHVAGAGIAMLSMVLDRADGGLARFTGQSSRRGHVFDLFSDALCNGLFFAGLGVGLSHALLDWVAVGLGLAAGVAVAWVFWMVVRTEDAEGERAAELSSLGGFDIDDAMFIFPVAVLAGAGYPLLVVAGIGAPLFALWFALGLRRPGHRGRQGRGRVR